MGEQARGSSSKDLPVQADDEPDKKRSKKEEKAEAEAAARRLEEQRVLSTTCLKPTASEAQKAMYRAYKAAPRFSELKDMLLQKFTKDKKCGWFQTCEQVKSEAHTSTNAGLRGYGTR